MGQQFQMFKSLEKEIERLKGLETPDRIFVLLDSDNKVIVALASTTTKGRINNHEHSRSITVEELEALKPRIESGEITYHALIDDIVIAEATENVE